MAFQSDAYQVLKEINWEIPSGDIQLLMGPVRGKTTCCQSLAGPLTPAAGKGNLLGEEITSMSRRLAQSLIGCFLFFQNFNLFPVLTALRILN